MPTTATIQTQIEAALAHKIPSALMPAPKMIRPVAETGIPSLDYLREGGLPIGAISELIGPECSGRTDIALPPLLVLILHGFYGFAAVQYSGSETSGSQPRFSGQIPRPLGCKARVSRRRIRYASA